MELILVSLKSITIFIGDDLSNTQLSVHSSDSGLEETCYDNKESYPAGDTVSFLCDKPVYGESVRIAKTTTANIGLCDTQVYDAESKTQTLSIMQNLFFN